MQIETEAQALQAMQAILDWAHAQPESTAEGGSTGKTAQRGRIVATHVLPDDTIGLSTYKTPKEAADACHDMEEGYRKWMAIQRARVTVVGDKVTIVSKK